MKLALVFLAVGTACFGQLCTNGPGQGLVTTVTSSCAEVDTVLTTSVTQRVDTYSTELRARIGNGAFLYDQTFNVAFSDPQVQAAINTAHNVLVGAGAVNFSGPTQLSNNQSLVGSVTNTVPTGSQTTQTIVTTTAHVGPKTITAGQWGICQSYALNLGPDGAPLLTGCVPGGSPYIINPGGTDFDVLTISLVNVSRTATTTNTFLTTQVYELDGFAQGVPVTPAPPSLLLALVGLMGAGLYMGRRRFVRSR